MTFPGYPLDTTRTNATPMTTRHPTDHNEERAAANDLQGQIDAAVGNAVSRLLADAKGDLLVASAADTFGRLPVGANGRQPIADSAQTLGIRWGYPQPPMCQVFDAGVAITEGIVYNVISWSSEELDPLGWHVGGALTRITPTVAGWYESAFGAKLNVAANVVSYINARPRLNGTTALTRNEDSRIFTTGGGALNPSMTAGGPLIHLNGTTDYLEMQFLMDSTDTTTRAWEVGWALILRYPD